MTDTPAKPDDRLKISINQEERSLFMSYGLLHELIEHVGNVAYVGMIPSDPDLSAKTLNSVLSERNEKGEITAVFNPFVAQIDSDTTLVIFQWVMGHVLHFFMRSLQMAAEMMKQHEPTMAKLFPPSPTGTAP